MKFLIINLLALFLHPRRYCFDKSTIVVSRLRIQNGNLLRTNHTSIKRSRISVAGKGNSINTGKADIHKATITVIGNNNQITIRDHTKIYNLHILIKSDNSLFTIDDYSSFGGGNIICAGDNNSICFGKDCMIAEGVEIWNSDTHIITIQGKPVDGCKPIIIHDHVWLGKDVTVLKGVTIGENAIVGMKSVVTRDIRPGTINAGVPATEIRDGANWQR